MCAAAGYFPVAFGTQTGGSTTVSEHNSKRHLVRSCACEDAKVFGQLRSYQRQPLANFGLADSGVLLRRGRL